MYRVRPVEEVDWYRVENSRGIQSIIESYSGSDPVSDEEYFDYSYDQRSPAYRPQYLLSVLQISDVGDSAVYLLNPEVRTAEGEWEAWFFASWRPGATRYRSFWEMMQEQYQDYRELRKFEEATVSE